MQQEVKVTYIEVPKLNASPQVVVCFDGEPFTICSPTQVDGVKDFFKRGFATKLLNTTMKNHLVKLLTNHPTVNLWAQHPVTGEPLTADLPNMKGRIYDFNYHDMILLRAIPD